MSGNTYDSVPLVLMVFANDRFGGEAAYLRNLARERREIEASMSLALERGDFRLIIESNAVPARVFDALDRHSDRVVGFHFAGHADPSGPFLEDDEGRPVQANIDGLAMALGQLPKLRWVFLNGCATADLVRSIQTYWSGPVIATLRAIRDDIAAAFGRRFYHAISRGRTIRTAFASAESEVRASAQRPDDALRPEVAMSASFRMLRPAGVHDDWPWILSIPASSPASGDWCLVNTRPDDDEALQTAIMQRQNLADRRAPASVIANADRFILELKRGKLHRLSRQLQPGQIIGARWHLQERIGSGGFADVWKAWDLEDAMTVAVKVLHPQFHDSQERRDRFFRGARQMARLKGRYVARVLVPQMEDDIAQFFVMEHLPGGDLNSAVHSGRLSTQNALNCIAQVAEALIEAHALGVIHRDIKPTNILLDDENNARLTDFDLVRAADTTGGTRSGALGTFIYAAPEALDNAATVSARCDVYGLGMSALFVLLGSALPPLVLRSPRRFLDPIKGFEPLKRQILRAVAWDPAERHANAEDFLSEWNRAMAASLLKELPTSRPHSSSMVLQVDVAVTNYRPALVRIYAGRFSLGSALTEDGRYDDEAMTAVHLAYDFLIANTPVTIAHFRAVMDLAPVEDGRDLPIADVTWNEAVTFCNRLSRLEGIEGAYQSDSDEVRLTHGAEGYRLPTEAEWEYSCRAGTSTRFASGDHEASLAHLGWYDENSGLNLHPVGQRSPNQWGLYDMHGNIYEWCNDWFGRYPQSECTNPLGPTAGTERVVRGGSYEDSVRNCRSAARGSTGPLVASPKIGFRIVRTLKGTT